MAVSDGAVSLFLRALSRLAGWLYTIAWSLSFYPQPLSNIRQRGTSGLTPDFPLLNVFGFSSYTLATALFLFSPGIRSQYAARHPQAPEPTVRGNDLVFGAHACVLVALTYSQFYPTLWGWDKANDVRAGSTGTKATTVSLGIIWGCLMGIAITACVALTGGSGSGTWEAIDVVYAISYVKLLLTIFKYIPQVIANHRRKSTRGWSVWQVLLDFIGGVLSMVQLVIDSARQGDWSGLTGNPVKLGLANISIAFDVIFIVQHYVLYGSERQEGIVADDGMISSDDDDDNGNDLESGRAERQPLTTGRDM